MKNYGTRSSNMVNSVGSSGGGYGVATTSARDKRRSVDKWRSALLRDIRKYGITITDILEKCPTLTFSRLEKIIVGPSNPVMLTQELISTAVNKLVRSLKGRDD